MVVSLANKSVRAVPTRIGGKSVLDAMASDVVAEANGSTVSQIRRRLMLIQRLTGMT